MILLVVGESTHTVERALPPDRESRVVSTDAAPTLLDEKDPDLLVVDIAVDGTAALVRSVRAGDFGDPTLPLVVVGEEEQGLPLLSFDATVARPVGRAFSAAVERGLLVSDYQDAVDRLYRSCQARARSGAPDPLDEPAELAAARERADALLDTLDDVVLSDLLWQPQEASVDGFGFATSEE